MDKKYIELFNGYKGAYGVADWTHVKIDPKTGKRAPEYRWNYEPFTDQVFIDHLNGAKSVGIQPTNENAQTKFAIIDVDPDKIPTIITRTTNQYIFYWISFNLWNSILLWILKSFFTSKT